VVQSAFAKKLAPLKAKPNVHCRFAGPKLHSENSIYCQNPKSLLFRAFADRYERLVSEHKRGRAVERYYIQMFVEIFGKEKINEITAEEGERFKTYRSRQVKPATVNRELTLLKHMFAKAVEWTCWRRTHFVVSDP
jgi:hypothetical protein